MTGMTAAVATLDKPRERQTTRQRTQADKQRALDTLRETLHTGQAAKAAGVSRSCLHNWRQTDPAFAEAWQDIIDNVCDDLEVVGVQRAIEGDTQALKFFLQSWRRAQYTQPTANVTVEVDARQLNIGVVADLSEGDLWRILGEPYGAIVEGEVRE
jgi:hypothetical protein